MDGWAAVWFLDENLFTEKSETALLDVVPDNAIPVTKRNSLFRRLKFMALLLVNITVNGPLVFVERFPFHGICFVIRLARWELREVAVELIQTILIHSETTSWSHRITVYLGMDCFWLTGGGLFEYLTKITSWMVVPKAFQWESGKREISLFLLDIFSRVYMFLFLLYIRYP